MIANDTAVGRVSAITLLSRHIQETKSLIETSVEAVCQSFEGTARLSQHNLEQTVQFLGQHEESAPGQETTDLEQLIEGSEQVLHHLQDRLSEAAEMSRSAIQRLKQIDHRIGQVAFTMEQINDITITNRILAVNARIQAAQHGHHGTSFEVVADEITMQAKRSTELSNHIASLIDQLRQEVTLAGHDLLATASHDREAMEQSRREVKRTHADFRRFLDRTNEFLNEAAADSRTLTREIHDSVRGLQFQDRASQRLDFIAQELDRLSSELAMDHGVEAVTGTGLDHPKVQQMMTRTSMREQRQLTGHPAAAAGGEVELF